jgi:predicted MPP superfamily phosphohydrolase
MLAELFTGLAGAGALAAAVWATRIAPERLYLHRLNFWHPCVPPAFHGYTIAQISDVHLDGTFRSAARLERAVDLALEAQPDLVVCTGDYITFLGNGTGDVLERALSRLRAPDGVLAVMGNHDYRQMQHMAAAAIAAAGAVDLNNRYVTLRRGGDALHIAGVDSVTRRRARLDHVLRTLPDDGMAILLAHEPDFADIAAPTGRFTLQLSGHTHGGQVNIPMLSDFSLPTYGRRYVAGLYHVDGLWVWVNRGVGTSGYAVRLFARPEVTLITLGRLSQRGG